MHKQPRRADKPITIDLLWLAMLFVFMIRYAMGAVAPTLMRDYGISPAEMGYVLSAWSWAYLAFYLVGGPLVDRFGAWAVLGMGSGLWSLATAALPLANSVLWLFSMRAVFGLATVMTIPVCAAAIARWFGPQERARAVAAVFSGNQVGLAVGATLAAFLLARLGWQAVFYFFGGASLLLTTAWLCFYPEKSIATRRSRKRASQPGAAWTQLLRYRSTWGIALGQMGYLYAFFFFFT